MSTPLPILGLHHVTALAGDPVRNDRFWTETMGLRRVKATVNFDDPGTYHLYFGDEAGSPGTLWTTFPHPSTRPGTPGPAEVGRTIYALPEPALQRLRAAVTGSDAGGVFRFEDPDKTSLGAVAAGDAGEARIDRVELRVKDPAPTEAFLREVFGFVADQAGVLHAPGARAAGGVVVTAEESWERSPGRRLGAGSVHHVAFRVADDAAQERCLQGLGAAGFAPTSVQDRQYFHSIYFREPGGVIFEIATDPPGFATDEPAEALGTALRLPPWLEPERARVVAGLVPLPGLESLPGGG